MLVPYCSLINSCGISLWFEAKLLDCYTPCSQKRAGDLQPQIWRDWLCIHLDNTSTQYMWSVDNVPAQCPRPSALDKPHVSLVRKFYGIAMNVGTRISSLQFHCNNIVHYNKLSVLLQLCHLTLLY